MHIYEKIKSIRHAAMVISVDIHNVALLVGLTNLGMCMNLIHPGHWKSKEALTVLDGTRYGNLPLQVKRGEHTEAEPSTKVV